MNRRAVPETTRYQHSTDEPSSKITLPRQHGTSEATESASFGRPPCAPTGWCSHTTALARAVCHSCFIAAPPYTFFGAPAAVTPAGCPARLGPRACAQSWGKHLPTIWELFMTNVKICGFLSNKDLRK